MAARMINAPPIHGSALLPPPESEDAPAAIPDSDDDDVGDAERVALFDARGDGVTEGVGVGDTGTTVGLAVPVSDFVGVGFTSLSLIVTRTSGSTT